MTSIVSADSIRTRIPFADGGGMTVYPELTLTTRHGRLYRFSWSKYLGPFFVNKDGEPRHHYPSERNPMWKDFALWSQQGRRVDEQGNCVWEPGT